jgi:ubiquinone/menaquinone biosynthesis C-methylase UbiE
MKPETVSLLCSPRTHEPLRLAPEPKPGGGTEEVLIGVDSGERFRVRDGIPLLLDESTVSGFNRRFQRGYNRVARLYDVSIRLVANLVGGGEALFRSDYLRELEGKDGACVLEVSIGTGANLRYMPLKGAFFGLDLSWGMIKQCQRHLSRWQLDAELILGNAEELPLRDETFDVVFHVGGINAFNDRAKAISEMVRVARAGTKIVIVDETAKVVDAFAWIPGFRRRMQEQYGDRLSPPVDLLPAGMREVQVRGVGKGNLHCLTFRKP